MARNLTDSVVVITGASSGIGRATALAFAEKGASVVLAARRTEALLQASQECEKMGARSLVVPTDVTDESQVRHLAEEAIDNFGRIDVWVNNAAVTLFGKVDETPMEAIRRLIETNIFGYLYGTRAVLPYFRRQGEGTLIIIDSVAGAIPQPYTSAYVMSKHAVRALAECLRMELALDHERGIHVCTVMPASIDTPLFQQAANFTGRAVKPMEPVYPPERVAAAIVRLAQSPHREVIVGNAGRLLTAQHTLSPALYERMNARSVDSGHFRNAPAGPTEGNLFEPMPQYAQTHGGWQHEDTAAKIPWAAIGAALIGAAAFWMASRGEETARPIERSRRARHDLAGTRGERDPYPH